MNNIFSDFNLNNCCGCGSCKASCPNNAIAMLPDEKGFLYPVLNSDACIECGVCINSCDFKSFAPVEKELTCYIARAKNENILETSQSGGIFALLAEECIKNSYSIYACSYNNDFSISHKRFSEVKEIKNFVGSKYMQSDLKNCFFECSEKLKRNEKIMFIGTPCQSHALIHFLSIKNIDTKNLLVCDIVCHGVPSQKVFLDYLKFIEKKYKSKVVEHNFRDKSYGWRSHRETIIFKSGKKITIDGWRDVYYAHNMLRESCFCCPYTTPYRLSDITISDAWGLEKFLPELDDDKGWSFIIIQSNKGRKMINDIFHKTTFFDVPIDHFLQPNLVGPSTKGQQYDAFWNDYLYNHSTSIKKWFFKKKKKHIVKRAISKLRRMLNKNGN